MYLQQLLSCLDVDSQRKKEVSKNDDHFTVYLWENRLMKNIAPYIHEQFPDQDI